MSLPSVGETPLAVLGEKISTWKHPKDNDDARRWRARNNLARRLVAGRKRENERKIRLLFAGVLAFDPLASHFDGVHFE